MASSVRNAFHPTQAYFDDEKRRLERKEESICKVIDALENFDAPWFGVSSSMLKLQTKFWHQQMELCDLERDLLEQEHKFCPERAIEDYKDYAFELIKERES